MSLTPHDIAKMLDHSTLQPFLTEADIRKGCELALKYDCASVCARPCDVPILAELLKGSDVKVCTVIGFPHGSHETAIKVAEAELALAEGCTELDMVINIGKMIAGDTLYVRNEIKLLADAAHAKGAILKVILETCYLTDEQKVACCQLAEAAGADYVGAEDMVAKIQGGWFDFDVVVATPDMMGQVGRLGRVLGPKGLMPSPKAGTVTMNVTQAIHDIKAGKVEYRVDKTAIIHCPVGKASFDEQKLVENLRVLMEAIIKAKPAAAKGTYIRSAVISSTMGPGIKLNSLKF